MDSTDNSPDAKDGDTLQRKNALETLSKDDLVKKCKHLLSIAQKAKQAKDEASDEVKYLKEQVNTLQGKYDKTKGERTKESPCQAEINAMQEMVATLTEQKLRLTMEMDAMLKHADSIEKQLEAANADEHNLRQALLSASARADEHELATESARRQIARLLQENDDLLQRLDNYELQIRKISSAKDEDIIRLQGKVTSLEGELLVFQEELDGVSEESRCKSSVIHKANEELTLQKQSLEDERECSRKRLHEAHEALDSAAHENEELEKRLRAVTEAAERDKQTLTERLAQLAVDMKRLEQCSSNAENLKDVMEILHNEKDQYFQEKEKLKHQNEILNEQVKIMTQENETILKEVEALKRNNIKLKQLVQDIQDTNTSLLKDISRMEAENQKLSEVFGLERDNLVMENKKYIADRQKILDRLESANRKKDIILQEHNILKSENRKLTECLEFVSKEKHILAEENTKYKVDNQKLNEYLEAIVIEKNQLYEEKEKLNALIETINTEKNVIYNENVELKDEKEKLNKDLRSASGEVDTLRAEVRDAERRVRSAVRQTLTVLQEFLGSSPDIAGESCIENFPAVMAVLEENLNKISSLSSRTTNVVLTNASESHVQKNDVTSDMPHHPSAEVSGSGDSLNVDEVSKLRLEVVNQRDIITNLQVCCENMSAENKRLRICLGNEELDPLTKLAEPWEKNNLLDELDCAKKQLVEKTHEVQMLRDEMSNVLQHQTIPRLTVVAQNDDMSLLRTELAARSAELDALKTEFARAKDMLKELTKVEDKEREIQTLTLEIDVAREKQASYDALIQKFKQEITSLQGKVNKFQVSLAKKNSEIDSLKGELKVLKDNEASFQSGMEIFHEEEMKLKEEVMFLQDELAERTSSLENVTSGVENLKEQCKNFNAERLSIHDECQNLQAEIKQLKDELNAKSTSLLDKCKECESIKQENSIMNEKLNEQAKLTSLKQEEVNEKSQLLVINEQELARVWEECSGLKNEATQKELNLVEKLNELEVLNQRYKLLEERVEDSSGKSQENIFKLQDKLIQFEKKLADKNAEIEAHRNEAHRLLVENEKLLKELSLKEEEILSLKEQLAAKTVETTDYMTELKKIEAEKIEMSDDFKRIIENKTEELNRLKEMSQNTNADRNEIENQIRNLESKEKEVDQLKKDLQKVQDDNESLINDSKKQQDIIVDLMRGIDERTSEVAQLRDEVRRAEERYCDKHKALESLTDELANVQNSSAEALERLTLATKELGEVREKLAVSENATRHLEEVQKNLQEEKNTKEAINAKLQGLCLAVGKLPRIVDNIKSTQNQLVNDFQNFREQAKKNISSTQISFGTTLERLAVLEVTRSQELLAEMNEMNQVLKQRGEVVSKLEARLHSADDKLTAASEELQVRERRIQEIEEELSSLRGRLQGTENECQNEVMSTSTLSRTEEVTQMKDVEESFEDRYTKLRTVAVKLKRRVAELTNQLTAADAERRQLLADRSDLTAHISQASAHAKNLQTVQLECDRLQDIMDHQTKDMKNQKKFLEKCQTENSSLQKQIANLTEQREKLELQLASSASEHSFLQQQLSNAQEERDTAISLNSELMVQVSCLQEEVKKLGRFLHNEEGDKLKVTCNETMEASRQECKKCSILSLEIGDYEQTVCDLQQQLVCERSKLGDAQENLKAERDATTSLQKQIKCFEESALMEVQHCREIKTRLAESHRALAETQEQLRIREDELAAEKAHKEDLCSRAEAQELQLTSLVGERERAAEMARSHQDSLHAQVLVLEDKCSRLSTETAEKDLQLTLVKSEFEAYKVRAQAVLRQKTSTAVATPVRIEGDSEECERLQRQCEALRFKLDEAGCRIEAANIQVSAAQDERDIAVRHRQELAATLAELRQKDSILVEQHHEALRTAKLQLETLHACYKQQLEETESRLKGEISCLSEKLKDAQLKLQKEVDSQPSTLTVSEQTNVSNYCTSTDVITKPPESLNVNLLEREEGEGSEYVEDSGSSKISTTREIVPLDQLLATSEDEDLRIAMTYPGKLSGHDESRVRHLASLLGEAEQDLARLSQLNSVLKEEVRRLTRSLERQQHTGSNLEYLKNVVLKFVTLHGGDERLRLVPVLNTLLKLSPDETSQLHQVARGASDGGGRGWSTYLHLWPNSP